MMTGWSESPTSRARCYRDRLNDEGLRLLPFSRERRSAMSSSGSAARRREVVMTYLRLAESKNRGGGGEHLSWAAIGGEARGERRLEWFIRFQVNSFHPASPAGAPGKIAASVRRFHLQHGVVRNRKKEMACRVSYQVLNTSLERTSEGDDIPPFHQGRSSH